MAEDALRPVVSMVILGAKGFAVELLSSLSWEGTDGSLVFFDNISDEVSAMLHNRFLVIRTWEDLQKYFRTNEREFLVGIGGTHLREQILSRAVESGGHLLTYISKHAFVGKYGNEIGPGSCIMPTAMVTGNARIGKGVLINKAAVVSHDAVIGDYCDISPGAKILGHGMVGAYSEIGANAVVLPRVTVGSNCKIGAGAVVTNDIPDNSVYAGIPARPLARKKNE